VNSTSGYGPNPPGVRRPTFSRRAAIATILLIPLLIVTVGVPAYVLGFLDQHGGSAGVNLLQTTAGGVALSALSALAYLLRPTRAYGPAVAARAIAALVYLLSLAGYASIAFPVGSSVVATLNYASLLVWLALVPAFSLIGALFITASDARDVDARLRRDFPA
jgi:hypothetical protein